MLYQLPGSGAERQDYNEFARQTRKAAEQGYPIAQFNLSYAYALGDGVERNAEQSTALDGHGGQGRICQSNTYSTRQQRIQAELQSRRQDVAGYEADRLAAQSGDAKAQFVLGDAI